MFISLIQKGTKWLIGRKEGLVKMYCKPQAYDIQMISGGRVRELNLYDLEAAFKILFPLRAFAKTFGERKQYLQT